MRLPNKITMHVMEQEDVLELATLLMYKFYNSYKSSEDPGEQVERLIEIMEEDTDLLYLVMIPTITCCVGNFDRIKKIETEAQLDEDGSIMFETYKEVDLDYVS